MRKWKVLFACADADTIDRMTEGLSPFGYDVVTCTRGRTAIELAQRHHVDIAILAIELIGYNGFEVCRELRSMFSDAELPLVVYASRDSRQWRLTAFESGANSFCFEPMLFDRLDSVLQSLLRFKRNLESSMPVTDVLRLLCQAYATPGPVCERPEWPRAVDIGPMVRYCNVLLEARTQLSAARIEESSLFMQLVLHMAAYLGSLSVALSHLEAVAKGTYIEHTAHVLIKRMEGPGSSFLQYETEEFGTMVEALTILLGLAERVFCRGEETMEALRRMRADERGYEKNLLVALESVVSKDEFLSSILG